MLCKSCGSEKVQQVFSLGSTPLANALVEEKDLGQPDETFPLDLIFCSDCALLQLKEPVDPARLFRNYLYQSGYSCPVVEDRKRLCADVAEKMKLGPHDLVVDIGSNDGSLLENYVKLDIRTLGVDPAENLESVARRRGVKTIVGFFNPGTAGYIFRMVGRARVIHAHNVLAHNPDPNQLIKGIYELLANDGLAIIDVPYVRNMIERCEFDTIYHEHVFYFSVTALKSLIERNGLVLSSVAEIEHHGGSLRLFIHHVGTSDASVLRLLDEEKETVCKLSYYRDFMARCEYVRYRLRNLLCELKREGKVVYGFGSPAKATTLLNFCEIGTDLIKLTIDDTPTKQGKWIPGVRIPIYAPSEVVWHGTCKPDYTVIFPWNMLDACLKRLETERRNGLRCIIPIAEDSCPTPVSIVE